MFTGPDANFRLNGIRVVAHIEDLLDRLEFVEAVRVPQRYAAPVDDDHHAKDWARGHGADVMLHIELDTTYSSGLKTASEPLASVPWTRDTAWLEAEGSSDVRLVLIDLSDDSVISDTTIVSARRQSGDIVLSGIHGTTRQAVLQLGGMSAPRELIVQAAPVGMSSPTLAYHLTRTDGLDLPSWGFETGADPLVGERLDPTSYSTLEGLESFSRITGHDFLLFDVLEFDPYGDGNLTYQYAYAPMGEGADGCLAASVYERELYYGLQEAMESREVQQEFAERFFTTFYETSIGNDVVKAIAPLL